MEIRKIYLVSGIAFEELPYNAKFFPPRLESGGIALPVLIDNDADEMCTYTIHVIDEWISFTLGGEIEFISCLDSFGTQKYIIVEIQNG